MAIPAVLQFSLVDGALERGGTKNRPIDRVTKFQEAVPPENTGTYRELETARIPMVPAMRAAIMDAMLEGTGLFDVAERFNVSAAEIVASTENEIMRRHIAEVRQAIVDHRKARQPPPSGKRRKRDKMDPQSSRAKLIELSLRWQKERGIA